MERVTFLADEIGVRVHCHLNPETLLWRRKSGIAPWPERGGALGGTGLSDDPLRFTGGGITLLDLQLLFDVECCERPPLSGDVRELTRPLWNLSENGDGSGRYAYPPKVRFLWGKSWNVLGVVRSIAERFDRFSQEGTPSRSWMSLRFQRINEGPLDEPMDRSLTRSGPSALLDVLEPPPVGQDSGQARTLLTESGSGPLSNSRADEIAARELGSPLLWKWIAYANDLVDPLRIAAGTALKIPSRDSESTP